MFDFDSLSDEERGLLEEVAKAKGQSLEETLIELGHIKPQQEDDEVVTVAGSTSSEELTSPHEVAGEKVQPTPNEAILEAKMEREEEEAAKPPVDESSFPPIADEEETTESPEELQGSDDLATVNSVCSLCGWDQSMPVIPEPEHKDKLGFLQSILGQKVFSKRYSIFGGALKVTFRTLTIKEIDKLYEAAFKAQKLGVITTTADYYEYLNRLRLYLQISALSAKTSALHIKLPEGLTRETHPDVKSYWDEFLNKEGKKAESEPLVNRVADYVVKEVLKTEQLQRTITHECNNFNRLVAKLEACVDNQDFWKETEQPS